MRTPVGKGVMKSAPQSAPTIEAAAPERYRVLRAILNGPGVVIEPGTVIENPDWPFGRARQLVSQGWLLPLANEE